MISHNEEPAEAVRGGHELELAKLAAAEWLEKYRLAEQRIDSVWNLALDAARMRIGHHHPRCFDSCHKCWIYEELGSMMRGDRNNYVPVKERARAAADEMVRAFDRACNLDPEDKLEPYTVADAYATGVHDMLAAVEKMLADRE